MELELGHALFDKPNDWGLVHRMMRVGVRMGMVDETTVVYRPSLRVADTAPRPGRSTPDSAHPGARRRADAIADRRVGARADRAARRRRGPGKAPGGGAPLSQLAIDGTASPDAGALSRCTTSPSQLRRASRERSAATAACSPSPWSARALGSATRASSARTAPSARERCSEPDACCTPAPRLARTWSSATTWRCSPVP